MLQALVDNWLYVLWLIGTGAACLALVSLHNNESDYLDDDMDVW